MSQKTIVINAASEQRQRSISVLWEYRELVWMMVLRDIKVRYKQTVLGVAWAVIQPLTAMLIFSIIFGRLAKIPSDGVPYPVFVFSGLVAWNFFSTAVSAGGVSMIGAGGMISKVYFPRLIVPLSSLGVSVVDFCISFILLLVIMMLYGVAPSWQIGFFPIFAGGLLVIAFSVSAWLAAITVMYRDFRFVIPFLLQIWMYVTPVIYPVSFLPEKWRWLVYLNPVNGWVDGLRACILGHAIDWIAVLISLLFTAIIFHFGVRYFARSERRFADVI